MEGWWVRRAIICELILRELKVQNQIYVLLSRHHVYSVIVQQYSIHSSQSETFKTNYV